jgi:hypothetical protein
MLSLWFPCASVGTERRLYSLSVGTRAISENEVSLEHICPYNPNEAWITGFGEGYKEVKDRLGNMLLLPKQINKEIDTKPFMEKKKIYTASGLKLAEKVANYDEWNKQSVDDFQHWMAELAIKVWKISYD